MTLGIECIKFMLEQDPDNVPIVQGWIDKWFWRGYRLLTIVAMMQGGDFFLSFKADHDGLRTVLNSHIQELERVFEEQGLNLKGVNVFSEGENRLEPFERLESLENIVSIKI